MLDFLWSWLSYLSIYPSINPSIHLAIPYTQHDDVLIHAHALTKTVLQEDQDALQKGTLYSPIIVGDNNFIEPMLIRITRISVGHINSQPTLIL